MLVRNVFLLGKMGLALLVVLALAGSASAYVGPGAGLELVGYTLSLAAWGLTAFSAVLLWPVYAVIRRMRRGGKSAAVPPKTPESGDTCADSPC